jgi:hypothetical protein
MTLLGAALRRITDVENEIAFRDRSFGAVMAERSRRVEHARCILWTALRAEGIDPKTMKPLKVC